MEQFEQAYMEEQILLLLDNELDAEQAGIVWAQIEAFPEYKALYEEYASVYLEQDEHLPVIDFSYLEKDSASDIPPMQIKKTFKPAWGIAAGVALILTTGILLRMNNKEIAQMGSGLVKSDKVHQTVQAPIQQLAIDSMDRSKTDIRKTPQTGKTKPVQKKNREPELRMALADQTTQQQAARVSVASIYQGDASGIARVNSTQLQEAPARGNKFYVSLPAPSKAIDELNLQNSNGLLPDMIKAGQWIFGERKNTTTVEIAIGNNEKRSIKFKL